MPSKRNEPGFGAYLTVLRLLLGAAGELLVLPFHIVAFLVNRKKVTREISRLLESRPRE